jgi:DNA-binding transcriptional LysR family regulator
VDRFDGMRAFVRVVEAGSFTKAARTLDMSRATVTQLIQQLETRLRVKLLHRTTRKVNVTEDGAVYYERVVHMLAEFDGWDIAPMPLYVAYPAKRKVSRKLRVFIDWIVELMEEKK